MEVAVSSVPRMPNSFLKFFLTPEMPLICRHQCIDDACHVLTMGAIGPTANGQAKTVSAEILIRGKSMQRGRSRFSAGRLKGLENIVSG